MIVNSHFNSTKNNVEIDGLSSCMLYFFTVFFFYEMNVSIISFITQVFQTVRILWPEPM